jgi:hypothetical protein
MMLKSLRSNLIHSGQQLASETAHSGLPRVRPNSGRRGVEISQLVTTSPLASAAFGLLFSNATSSLFDGPSGKIWLPKPATIWMPQVF